MYLQSRGDCTADAFIYRIVIVLYVAGSLSAYPYESWVEIKL
jgi:hypothetical protein